MNLALKGGEYVNVTNVAASSQGNAGDSPGKPGSKDKRQLDVSEVWAAIFAQFGALAHAGSPVDASEPDASVGQSKTPSAVNTSVVRATLAGTVHMDVEPSPPRAQNVQTSASQSSEVMFSDTMKRANTAAEGAREAADKRVISPDPAVLAHSVQSADVGEQTETLDVEHVAPREAPQAFDLAPRTVQSVARVFGREVERQQASAASSTDSSAKPHLAVAERDVPLTAARSLHRQMERATLSSGGAPSSHADKQVDLRTPIASPVSGSVVYGTQFDEAKKPDTAPVVTSTVGALGDDLRAWVTSAGEAEPKTLMVALEPKELGALKVIVHHGDDGLQIQLVASSSASANLLAAQLPALVQQMAQGGLSVHEVSVGLDTDAGQTGSGGRQRDGEDASKAGTANVGSIGAARAFRAKYGAEDEGSVSLINLYA